MLLLKMTLFHHVLWHKTTTSRYYHT